MVLHEGERAMQIGEREWSVVQAMDGSRDVEGIALASRVATPHVRAFVEALEGLGLLGEDAEDAPPPAFAADRPVRALPGYRFTCDGRGACCATFSTVLFTPLEAARARAAAPEVEDGGHDAARVFTPAEGLDRTLQAVAMRDGACVYLGDDGCRIHAAAGAEAKPFGCRTFPMRFVDTGAEIRVAPRPECACVFAPGADPITDATRGGELPRALHVPTLGVVRMGPDEVAPGEFIAWSDARRPSADAAAWCAGTADAVAREGRAAEDREGDPARLRAIAAGVGARAERLASVLADHRGDDDPLRRRVGWLLDAARRVGQGQPRPEDEALYLRATLFGGWLGDAPSVEDGLRDLGAHILLARAFPPGAPHPLAIVESLARAHGLAWCSS